MLSLASQSLGLASPMMMSSNADAPIKLGVNGFGRIGRQVVRIAMDRESFILKHINSPMAPEYMKYLLEHDTVHGRFSGTCEVDGDALIINGAKVTLSATRVPAEIPWTQTGVEYVCESTGAFTTTEGCMAHIEGGAKKVIISAPAKDADTPTLVVGVNQDEYDSSMAVVSCASCTTNGLAPLVKVITRPCSSCSPRRQPKALMWTHSMTSRLMFRCGSSMSLMTTHLQRIDCVRLVMRCLRRKQLGT